MTPAVAPELLTSRQAHVYLVGCVGRYAAPPQTTIQAWAAPSWRTANADLVERTGIPAPVRLPGRRRVLWRRADLDGWIHLSGASGTATWSERFAADALAVALVSDAPALLDSTAARAYLCAAIGGAAPPPSGLENWSKPSWRAANAETIARLDLPGPVRLPGRTGVLWRRADLDAHIAAVLEAAAPA